MRRHCGLSRSAPATPMVGRWQSRRISAQLQALLRSAIAFLMMVPKGARVSASNHDDASLFPPAPRHAGDVPHLGVSLLFGGLKFAASTPKRTLARGT